MQNILFYSPAWPLGYKANGIVSYVDTITTGLKSFNINLYVMTGNYGSTQNQSDIANVITMSKRQPRNIIDKIYAKLAPYQYQLKSFESTFIESFNGINSQIDLVEIEESFGYSYYLQKKLSIPVIVRLHGPWFLNGKALGIPEDKEFFRRISYEKQAIENAVGITAPSKDVLEQTREYYGLELKNAMVIPCPAPIVSEDKYWQWEKCNPEQITFIGRFDYHKGGDIVIDAFRYVLVQNERISLCFAGVDRGIKDNHGNSIYVEDYIKKVFPDSIQRQQVKFLGKLNQEELQNLRINSGLTIIASRYEVFGYTIIEAMTQGCPIIASNVGGIPEIIKDGYSGLLFETGNAKDLASKILNLINNKDLAIKLGYNAKRECRNNLSPKSIASQTLEFYKEVQSTFNSVNL